MIIIIDLIILILIIIHNNLSLQGLLLVQDKPLLSPFPSFFLPLCPPVAPSPHTNAGSRH